VSQQAITLAAMLHRGGQLGARVLLLVGARSEAHIVDSIGAAAVRLTDAETAQVMGAL
jgi:aryl-alcohol dehydrogenase-like predicted oxidoreductase